MPANTETAQAPVTPSQDKQLRGVALAAVLQKRQLGQALNAKEFAVLVGVSYSTARGWFRLAGFPVIRGFVFWEDFVRWRMDRSTGQPESGLTETVVSDPSTSRQAGTMHSPRVARILAEAG